MSLNFNGINIGGGGGTNSTHAVPDYSQGESLRSNKFYFYIRQKLYYSNSKHRLFKNC